MSTTACARLLVTALVAATIPAATARPAQQAGEPPAGEWRVTRLTGSIEYTTTGPAPPDGMCEPSTETYPAVAQDSYVELAYLEHGTEPIVASRAEQEMSRVMLEYGDLMPSQRDLESPAVDPTHLFLFSFWFENGYHSNEVLDAEVEFSPSPNGWEFTRMVAARRDSEDQSKAMDTFATVLSKLNEAFGGGEGYVGTWFSADDRAAFLDSSHRIFGIEGVTSGGGDAGKSLFLVLGEFDDARAMSGEWYFKETSQLLDCTSNGTGSGSWRAEIR